MKRLINNNEETKYNDTFSIIGSQYGSAGTLAETTLIAPGNTNLTRIGNRIKPLSIESRFLFENQNTNPLSLTRIIYFQWRPDNIVPPTLGDILRSGPGAVTGVFCNNNYDQRKNYRIIKDISFPMVQGTLGGNPYLKHFHIKIPLSKLPYTNYTGALNTGDHHIYVLVVGSNAAGATGQLVTQNHRVLFKDA